MRETQNNQNENKKEADQLNLNLEKEIEHMDRTSGEEFQGYEPVSEKPKKEKKPKKPKKKKTPKQIVKKSIDRSCGHYSCAGCSIFYTACSWKEFPFFGKCEHEKRD